MWLIQLLNSKFFFHKSCVSCSRRLSFAVYAIYIIRSSSPDVFICVWIHKEWNTHHTAVIANQNGHKLPAGRCLLYDRRQLLNCGCIWPAISEYTQAYIVAWIQPSGQTTQQRHYDAKTTSRRFDVIMTLSLRHVPVGLGYRKWAHVGYMYMMLMYHGTQNFMKRYYIKKDELKIFMFWIQYWVQVSFWSIFNVLSVWLKTNMLSFTTRIYLTRA